MIVTLTSLNLTFYWIVYLEIVNWTTQWTHNSRVQLKIFFMCLICDEEYIFNVRLIDIVLFFFRNENCMFQTYMNFAVYYVTLL